MLRWRTSKHGFVTRMLNLVNVNGICRGQRGDDVRMTRRLKPNMAWNFHHVVYVFQGLETQFPFVCFPYAQPTIDSICKHLLIVSNIAWAEEEYLISQKYLILAPSTRIRTINRPKTKHYGWKKNNCSDWTQYSNEHPGILQGMIWELVLLLFAALIRFSSKGGNSNI